MFLWLVLRQRLLTNAERVRRGMSFDPSCSCCGCFTETILHILRDCPPMRSFWQSLIPQSDHDYFFGAPLEHWIFSNIRTSRVFGRAFSLLSSGRFPHSTGISYYNCPLSQHLSPSMSIITVIEMISSFLER
ncbi:hypothetical protein V6N12_051041 [Hibiscus sabdariffa]|uniref:Reverse transcriptase zinc-binding domain-containing protein n=1 Tax=Hibiscus sabdariffa TaxID=183260 RepID=A0ABR2GE65_9ROSI